MPSTIPDFKFRNYHLDDLPKIIKNKSIPILFANDVSILFSHSNFKGFEENMNTVFETLNNWFERNIKSSPVTSLEWPRGSQEVKVPRFHGSGTGRW